MQIIGSLDHYYEYMLAAYFCCNLPIISRCIDALEREKNTFNYPLNDFPPSILIRLRLAIGNRQLVIGLANTKLWYPRSYDYYYWAVIWSLSLFYTVLSSNSEHWTLHAYEMRYEENYAHVIAIRSMVWWNERFSRENLFSSFVFLVSRKWNVECWNFLFLFLFWIAPETI